MPGWLRSNRPILISIVAIGVPLVVLLGLRWRSLDRFDIASGRLMRLASIQLADAVAQQVRRDFTRTHGALLEQLDHEFVRQFDLERIGAFVRSMEDELCFVHGLFVANAHPTSARIYYFPINGHHGPRELRASPAISPDPTFSALLRRKMAYAAALRRSVDFGEFEYAGGRYHVLVHPLYTTRKRVGTVETFMGFTVSYAQLRDHYLPEVIRGVIARYRTQLSELPAAPVVSVIDEGGTEIYLSGRSLQETYKAELQAPVSFVDAQFLDLRDQPPSPARQLRIRTGYESGTVAALVQYNGQQQRWLWTGTAFLVVTGLVLTLLSTYREVRLARAKLEFLSRLSHDAKTPLANIRLFADTLKARPNLDPAKAQQYYDILSSQAQWLAHRIGGILDMARFEAGIGTYALERVDLKVILQSAFDAYNYELAQAGFDPELALPECEVPVMGNPDGLEQVFGNLIENAVKYSGTDKYLRIALTTANGWARVDVTDRGVGIPPEEQQKIFRKFYRVPQSSGSTHGWGLGLATVAHVVRAHQGNVGVSSTPGRETTFDVQVPLIVENVR